MKKLLGIVTMGALVSLFTSCTKGMQAKSSATSNQSTGGVNVPPPTPPAAVTGVYTTGLPILSQAYSMVASSLQLNVDTMPPSNASRDEFRRQSTNLSDSGAPSSVSSAFSVAFTTLSAQLCLDRVGFENNAANAAKKAFFNSVNLGAAPATSLTDQNIQTVINRLARSIWQRDETVQERTILLQAVKDSMADDATNNANKTQEAMLFLCTAMTSSLQGMQL